VKLDVKDFIRHPEKCSGLVGMVYKDSSFTSASVYPDWTWHGDIKWKIRGRKGLAGIWIEPHRNSTYEGEWLLDRDTQYRVLDAKTVGNLLEVEVEIVEEGRNARKAPRR
jgi:hypothetical protein